VFVGDWAARGAAYWPSKIAVVDDATGRSFTYADMERRSESVAAWLRNEGVGRGDRVGALAHNGVEILDLLFACGKLGAIFVPYNWRLAGPELDGFLSMTTPRFLFCSGELLAAGRGAAERIAKSAPVDVIDVGVPGAGSDAYADILATRSETPVREEALHAEDTWVLLFTGGTTGLPKAVKVSHRMAAWNVLTTTIHHVRHDDVTVVHTPMFHTGGLFVHALPVLTLGGKVVILRRWDAAKVLALVPSDKLSVFFAVPTQLQEMAAQPGFREADFSSLRLLISGGAPLPLAVPRLYREQHGIPVAQGFGMTEFGPNALMLSSDEAEARAGSIGKPNYFVDARVVGKGGAAALAGEVGELCLRGGGLCSGYFGVPGDALGEDGWFHTGDLARVDDGYFTIVGRLKDMFVSGGENVYPLEIEDALYLLPGGRVRQCAVIGVPDDKWGEVGHAFVVPADGAELREAEVMAFLRTRLAGYKVPKRLEIVDALPISAAGKILKTELRERVHASRATTMAKVAS
jgi:fatty-acyl-CoA synthase